jgi:hypothetical protein
MGPVQFDGSHEIGRLPVGYRYAVYAEPLDGVLAPAQIAPTITSLCRNATTDPGWPPPQGCVVPAANTSITTRVRPGTGVPVVRQASQAASHVPPNNRPGPSEARKIGLGLSCAQAFCSALCSAAPHVEEPRFPEVRAMGGNVSGGTPVILASRESRRGFG